MMEKAILQLESVSKFYTSGQNVVVGLNSVTLAFHTGEFVAITGESGSGKSTLSHVLSGILPYESGEMYINGRPTSHYDGTDWERYRRDNISFISQNYGILPGATVLMNVVSALRLTGMDKIQAREAAQQILEQVGLWDLKKRRAAKLSSGQKQRLSIARALAKPAPILIADEPTGNLDPENSTKVIELLAQAAKTRLVLLVTHEYDEAKDHVTRHIRLQDGRVVMDASVREAEPTKAKEAPVRTAKRSLSGYVASLQLRSRPVWAAIMALFFTLTAFAVFAFLGTFIIALDDTDTRIYDDSAFANGARNRIVVTTIQKKPLTQQDYDAIVNTPYVQALERNGYVTDVQYSYRKDIDYEEKYSIHTEGNPDAPIYVIETTYIIKKGAPYMQTVPELPADAAFLQEGTLPESFYEIIAHRSCGYQVGDRVMVFLTNPKFWGENVYLKLNFTVTGITDYGEGLYFSDDVGRFCQQAAKIGNQFYAFIPEDTSVPYIPVGWEDRADALEGMDFTLTDEECRLPSSLVVQYMNRVDSELRISFALPNINLLGTETDPLLLGNRVTLKTQKPQYVYDDTTGEGFPIYSREHGHKWHTRLIEVSANTFDKMTWQAASEQVSITIEDYAYTDQVLGALEEKGYIALSPFRLGSTQQNAEKAQQREQTLTVCILALLAVFGLQLVLLRALFSIQTESYQMLRNLGLVSKDAKLSILWQVLIFTVLGQTAGGAAIWICGTNGIQRIAHILKYLPGSYVVILSTVHLAVSTLSCLWVIRALGKQVYPLAGKHSDMELEEETEVVL